MASGRFVARAYTSALDAVTPAALSQPNPKPQTLNPRPYVPMQHNRSLSL